MRGHRVHVYEDDASLTAGVGGFLNQGVRNREPVVVIATPEHRQAFQAYRKGSGKGYWIEMDAQETLDRLLVDGVPDSRAFASVMADAVRQIAPGSGHFRAFGEMVELLAWQGRWAEAERLEALWNGYAREHEFALLCAYSTRSFAAASGPARRRICMEHESVHATSLGALGVVDHLIVQAPQGGTEVGVPRQRAVQGA